MRAVWRSDTGRVRKLNEDSLYAGRNIFVVADGMGGHQAGEVASSMAAKWVGESLDVQPPLVGKLLNAISQANLQVFEHSRKEESLRGMGTTLTALWADTTHVLLAQIGDSRAYLLRGGILRQCTHDHSVVAEWVRTGVLSVEEARNHPRRNMITRALGTEKRVDADIFEIGRRKGDRWLICSDGLTNHVCDFEIAQLLSQGAGEETAEKMLQMALNRGGLDNISLILLEDEEGGDEE